MSMKETIIRFDAERIARRVMAMSALEAVKSGNYERMLGSRDMRALTAMAATQIGLVAAMLRPFALDYSPEDLTLTLMTEEGSDCSLAFHLLESSLTAFMADDDTEGEELVKRVIRILRQKPDMSITPTW